MQTIGVFNMQGERKYTFQVGKQVPMVAAFSFQLPCRTDSAVQQMGLARPQSSIFGSMLSVHRPVCVRNGALPPTDQCGVRNGGHERPRAAAAAAAGRAGQGNGALTHENAIIWARAARLRTPLRAAGVLLADQRALGARAHGGPPARPVANGLLANGLARGLQQQGQSEGAATVNTRAAEERRARAADGQAA